MNSNVRIIYENCKRHMRNTPEDWNKAANAFIKLYSRIDDSGKKDCLAAYDRLAKETESSN